MTASLSVPTEEISFDDHGLVPCVVQDSETGEVLTLAYMDEVALRRTRETGEIHFFSRSRGRLWHKGETSGHVQWVRALRYDCDADALVALVNPSGPACHTGERSCFFRGDLEPATYEALTVLERVIAERRTASPRESYTAALLGDPSLLADKVKEEAAEVVGAAQEESDDRLASEAADLLYHLAVLLASRRLAVGDALEVLNGRRR